MKILGIAVAAFIETVRQPVYFLVLALGGLLLFGSSWVTLFGFGREAQIVRETGIAGAVVAGLFIVFVTVPGTIADEIRNKQILAILVKPVRGFDLAAGKFLGLGIALAIAFAWFALTFGLSLYLKEGGLALGALLGAYFLAFLQVLTMGAVTILFSIFLPAPAAVICGFGVFAAGNLIPYLTKKLELAGAAGRGLGEFVLLWFPDLLRLNSSFDFASGRTASVVYLLLAALYAGVYACFVLTLSGLVLSRKEIA